MMDLRYSLLYMIVFSFIVQYFFMSLLMTSETKYIKHSISKVYLSSIMACLMGIIEVLMYDSYMNTTSWKYYIILLTLLVLLIILYRKQIYVDEKNYLNEMIEHHSMALLTSKNILDKTSDNELITLANNIIKSQQSEINYINNLLLKHY
jgi:hypothetical protein